MSVQHNLCLSIKYTGKYLGRAGGGCHPTGWKFTKTSGENWPRLVLVLVHLYVLEISISANWIVEATNRALSQCNACIQSTADWVLSLHCTLSCVHWVLFVHCELFSFCTILNEGYRSNFPSLKFYTTWWKLKMQSKFWTYTVHCYQSIFGKIQLSFFYQPSHPYHYSCFPVWSGPRSDSWRPDNRTHGWPHDTHTSRKDMAWDNMILITHVWIRQFWNIFFLVIFSMQLFPY